MPHVLAQDLRLSIFDKAISGGLSKHFDSDGDVRTQIENAKSVKANYRWEKGKKKVVILPVDQDLDITIPDWWSFVRLGDLVSILGRIGFRGFTKSDFTNENGAISLSPGNLLPTNKMTYATCSYITKEKYEESPEIQIENGDLLLVKTGSSYGKAAIVEKLPKESTINPQLVRIVSHSINVKYLLIVFSSMFGKNQFESFVTGTATPTFSQEKIANFIVPLPPIEEQARIVARVDELMAKIDEYEKIEKELVELQKAFPENMKDAILQAAMQGKLTEQSESDSDVHENILKAIKERDSLITQKKIAKVKDLPDPSDDTIPFEIPEQWSWISSDKVGSIVVGATPSTGNSSFWNEGSIPWLPSGCCQDCLVTEEEPTQKKITIEGYNSCSTKMMPINTVMIALTGATAGKVGLLKFEACGNQSIVGITPFSAVLPEFLYYQLMSRRGEILADCVGSAQPHISKDYVTKMAFVAPPIEEQQRIVDKLNQLLPLCESLEAMI